MGAVIVVLGIAVIGMFFLLASSLDESPFRENKRLKAAIKNWQRENEQLRKENKALRMGLPYPSVDQYDRERQEILEKVKQSIREEYPDIEFK